MPVHTVGLKLAAAIVGSLALSGCDLSAGEENTTAAQQAGESWILVQEGDQPEDDPEPATVAPERDEEMALHVPAAHKAAAEAHDPRCTGNTPAGVIAPLTVNVGTTTVTIRWYHPGDPTVTTYRATGISQDLTPGPPPELTWQQIKPGDGCRELTATVTGLQRDTAYVFSVDAVRKPTWSNTTRAATIARSSAVSTS